jgi:hypothetical protein
MTEKLILDDVKLHPHTWISLYSEIATMALEYSSLDNIWVLDENGDERMTEDKQDEFNYLVDNVEQIMSRCGLVKEDFDGR